MERPIYAFEGFHVDARRRVLSRASGNPIPLAPKAFDTLLYFVEHQGELLDKRTLLDAIWPHAIVEENNLNQSISTLRRVLGETPGEHRFIVIETPTSFTPDGTRVVVWENLRDLSVLNLAQPDRLEPLLHDESSERSGEVSPDGHWIAYESDESGKVEIYLRPFPDVGARREKISLDGGRYPRWGRQGSGELFYVTLDGAMMVASVQLSPSLELGRVTVRLGQTSHVSERESV